MSKLSRCTTSGVVIIDYQSNRSEYKTIRCCRTLHGENNQGIIDELVFIGAVRNLYGFFPSMRSNYYDAEYAAIFKVIRGVK